jgi:hypothetical protein
MKKHTISGDVVKPLKQTYTNDDSLKIDGRRLSMQGLQLEINDANRSPTDVKINNHSVLTLTNKKYTKHLFRVEPPNSSKIYPYIFTTYMIFADHIAAFFNLDDVKPDNPRWKYPGTFAGIHYLTIEELETDSITDRSYTISDEDVYTPIIQYTNVPNTRLFHVELLDKEHCRVYHDDSYVRTALTYSNMDDPTARCEFKKFTGEYTGVNGAGYNTTPLGRVDYSPYDDQVFQYIIDTNSGYLSLRKKLADGTTTWITHQGVVDNATGRISSPYLAGEQVVAEQGKTLAIKSIIRIRVDSVKNPASSISRAVDTMWCKYDSGILNQNTVNVDQTKARIYQDINREYYTNTYTYLQNNYLTCSQFYNVVDNELDVNLIPLKNQLTPYGDQCENSPHSTGTAGEFCLDFISRKNVDFRTYHKLNSGMNQITGDDKLLINYTSYVDKITLKSDQITYFHMPNIMKPFTWMNINYRRVAEYPEQYPMTKLPVAAPKTYGYEYEDFVGLIRAGAIAGNSPVNSDKIFKKRANYRYYTPWGDAGLYGNKGGAGDSHYGTWLCSWLMAVPGSDIYEKTYGPVWMDRYYDDKLFSENQIMSKEPNCFDSMVDAMDAGRNSPDTAKSYFDIPSNLRLERGVQYAYYHVGNKENKKIIDTFSNLLEQQDVSTYVKDDNGTRTDLSVPQIDGYNVYDFPGDQYCKTKSPYPAYGDFRVSFWLHSDDWTEKFGHQIYGNYTNAGLAMVNDHVITPVLTFVDDDDVKITNSDAVVIGTIDSSMYDTTLTSEFQDKTVHLVREDPLDRMTILTSTSANSGVLTVNTFDINGNNLDSYTIREQGVLFKKAIVSSTIKTINTVNEYTGVNKSETFIYTLHQDETSVCRFEFATGEYIDLSPTFFEWCVVYNLDDQARNITGYDGLYTRDTTTPPFNGKPVYRKTQGNIAAMYYEDNKWHITENTNTLTEGAYKIQSEEAEIPTTFSTTEPSITPAATGEAAVAFSEAYPKPKYIHAEESDTDWSSVYAPIGNENLYVLTGEMACSSHVTDEQGSNKLYFVKNKNIYSHDLTNNTLDEYVASKVFDGTNITKINNIKLDHQENLWVLYDDRYMIKYDTLNNQVFRVDLYSYISDSSQIKLDTHVDTVCTFDIISEYKVDSIKETYALVLYQAPHADAHDTTTITVDMNGVVKVKQTQQQKLFMNINPSTNFSNFDYINRAHYKHNNMLTFKFKAVNKYNTHESVVVNYDFPIYKLTPGWHHFCFGFDASEKGAGYFQIDGLFDDGAGGTGVVPLLRETSYGKYAFTEMLSKAATIGATQGYNDVLLCDYLKQPGYYFTKNMQMKSFRLYKFNLFRVNVQSLAREHVDIHDMEWTIPCGRRAHLDHVDKFHKHQLPGHKSVDFKTHVINSGLSDSDVSAAITSDNNVETAGGSY